jgi:hypothetical protein
MKHKNLYALQLFDISDFRNKVATFVLSTNKTDRHDIAEILLKVALNTIIVINP